MLTSAACRCFWRVTGYVADQDRRNTGDFERSSLSIGAFSLDKGCENLLGWRCGKRCKVKERWGIVRYRATLVDIFTKKKELISSQKKSDQLAPSSVWRPISGLKESTFHSSPAVARGSLLPLCHIRLVWLYICVRHHCWGILCPCR